MRPRVNIYVCICPLAMNNSCSDVSSGRMRRDSLKWLLLYSREPTCTRTLISSIAVHTHTITNPRWKIRAQTLISKDLNHTFSHEQGEEDLSSTGPCHQWWQTDIPFSPFVLDHGGGSSTFSLTCNSNKGLMNDHFWPADLRLKSKVVI